jgi:hypothetical protein
MYDKCRYSFDVRTAWKKCWPAIRKGLAAPIRTAMTRKWQAGLADWFLMFAHLFQFVGAVTFFSLRLLFNR